MVKRSLNVTLALLVTCAFRRWSTRALLCLAMLATLRLAPRAASMVGAADIAEMHENIAEGPGYEGTDEYVPVGGDAYEIDQNARRVVLDGDGQAQIHVLQWEPESKSFTVLLSQPSKLALRLFNYPAWQVEVNGQITAAETHVT